MVSVTKMKCNRQPGSKKAVAENYLCHGPLWPNTFYEKAAPTLDMHNNART